MAITCYSYCSCCKLRDCLIVSLTCVSKTRTNGSSQTDIINATFTGVCTFGCNYKTFNGSNQRGNTLNPGQTPVMVSDQLLFALAKQIQWQWPESYGEYKFVVMFGGLHVEMAALKWIH